MAYTEKIYVAYDGANDNKYYNEIKEWKQSDGSSFDMIDGYDIYQSIDKVDDETLKAKLQERMNQAKVCVLLIGEFTKSYRKFTRWQVEYAINSQMPIIAMNVNGIRSVDFDRAPTSIKKNLSLHISYQEAILELALKNWPQSHQKYLEKEKKYNIRYDNSVYDALGLETYDL